MSIQNYSDCEWQVEKNGERLGLLSGVPLKTESVTKQTGTSWYASVFVVVNAALGAGLLEFPWAYNAAGGVVVAIVVQAVLLVFIMVALLVLPYCSDIDRTATYQDVVQSMCGKLGRMACSVCIALYCFGTCITFLIIIGDQLDRFFLSVTNNPQFCDDWYYNRKFTITISSIVLILPLCFPKRIDFLKYASAFGVVGVVYVVLLVIIEYFVGNYPVEPIKTSPTYWTDVFTVVPTICFGYQCHVSVIPVYSCMEKRTVKEFSKTISVSIIICVLSYTVAAVFGYWTFGARVKEDILVSYNTEPQVLVGIIMIAAKTYTTYPILLFCGRLAFDDIWTDLLRKTPAEILRGERTRRIVQVIIWFAATVVLAAFIPNIAIVIALLGGLAAIFIFVFPGLCLLQVGFRLQDNLNKHKFRAIIVFSAAFVVIGIFLFGVTTAQAIVHDILSTDSSESPKIGCT